MKILRNLQRSLVVTLGILGPGGTPGDIAQAILPQFRGVLGGLENHDWFVVNSKHACDVMGFLTPHMHIAPDQTPHSSPPLAMDLQYACKPFTPSPSMAAMQPITPDLARLPEGGESLLRTLSRTYTPSGLAVIPEYDHAECLQNFPEGEQAAGEPESVGSCAKVDGSSTDVPGTPEQGVTSHPCTFTSSSFRSPVLSDRRWFETIRSTHPPLETEVSSSTVCAESSDDFLYAGNGEFAETEDLEPPALAEEGVQYSFEDSESGQDSFGERFRASASVGRCSIEWRHSSGWPEFGPESPTDDTHSLDLWDFHQTKLEELEDALQRIKM